MKNVREYAKNLGRSIKYSAVDNIKKQAPAITEMASMNSELYKEIRYALINRRQLITRTDKLIKGSKMYDALNETKKSVFEDLKTGNFYNKSRIESISKKAMGWGDDSDTDMDFGDGMDFDFSDDDNDFDLSDGDIVTVEAIESSSKSSAAMISNAVAKSSDYIVESNKAVHKMSYIQNIELFNGLNKSIGSLNENLLNVTKGMTDTLVTHAQNSTTFFEEATKYNKENNALLKELVEMERNRYKQEQERDRTSTRYDDVVGSDGGIDFKAYFKQVAKNAANKSSGISSINSMFGEDSNALLTMAGSPLKFITDTLTDKIIGNNIKSSIQNLDKSISGAFATLLSKFNLMSRSENGIVRNIGDILGLDNRMKKDIDTSKYHKGPVQWDGKSKRALEYVLPTYLSKILAAVSGQHETVYDYESGKFKTRSSLSSEYRDKRKSAVDSATLDSRSEFEEMLKTIKFKREEDNKSLKEDMDSFFSFFFNNGIMFDHIGKDHDFYKDMGLNIDSQNYDIFRGLFKSMSRSSQMKFNADIQSGRNSFNDEMERLEREGSLLSVLFDDSKLMKTNEFDKKGNLKRQYGISGMLTNNVDERGKNIFWYLRNVYETLATGIKVYSLNGSSGGNFTNRKSKNKQHSDVINKILNRSDTVESDNINYTEDTEKLYSKKLEKEIQKNSDIVYADDLYAESNDVTKSTMIHIDEVKKRNKLKEPKKETFIDKLLKTGNLTDKVNVIVEKINKITSAPGKAIANAINLADIRLYEVLYGTEEQEYRGEKVHGIIDRLVVDMKHVFNNFNSWLDEKILTPIKDKLDKRGGFSGMFKSALESMGIDPDNNLFTKAKEYFFGPDSIFAEIKDNVKQDFGEITGFVKRSLKDVYKELDEQFNITSKTSKLKAKFMPSDKSDGEIVESSPIKSAHQSIQAAGNKVSVTGRTRKKIMTPEAVQAAKDLVQNMPWYDTGAKYINKTQVALLHKGEAVLRPEERKEWERLNNLKNNFKNRNELGSKFGREYNNNYKSLANDENFKDEDSLLYRMNSEFKDIMSRVKFSLFGTEDLGNFDEKFTKAKEDVSKNFKEYFPKLASGGFLGGAGAFLFGVNPLLGASIGAAASLIKRSENVQNYLFGDKIDDEYQGGALLSKKAMKVIQTYVPDMTKYGIAGAVTGLIPFVPGGPITGLMLGAGVGFLKHNREFSQALFGNEMKIEDAIGTIKKKLPKIGIGAIGGAVLGPFGLMGNLMVGSAVGWMSDSDKFKEAMYGTYNEDTKQMEGGVLPAIRNTVIKPITEWSKGIKDNVLHFLSEEVRKPLKMAFKPIAREFKHIGKMFVERVGKGFDSVFEKFFGHPTKEFLELKVFGPMSKLFGNIGKGMLGLGKFMLTSPIRMLTFTGDHLANKQLKRDGIEGFDDEELLYRYQKNPKKFIKQLKKNKMFNNMDGNELNKLISGFENQPENSSITTEKSQDNEYNKPNSIEIDSNNQLKQINETMNRVTDAVRSIKSNQENPEKVVKPTEYGVLRYDVDSNGETRIIQDGVHRKVMAAKENEEAKKQALYDFLLANQNKEDGEEQKEKSFFSKIKDALGGILKFSPAILSLGALIASFLPNKSRTDADGSQILNTDIREAGIRGIQKSLSNKLKLGKGVVNTVKNTVKKVADNKVVKKSKDVIIGAADNITKKAINIADNSKVLNSGMKMIDDFIKIANKTLKHVMDDIVRFCSKFGLKINPSHVDNILKSIKGFLRPSVLANFTGKISSGLLRMGTSAASFLLSDGLAAIWGGLTGGTKAETANLFHIPQDYVTMPMRIIGGSMKALLNVSYVFVIDIINEVSIMLTGNDFIHSFAVTIYDVFASDNSMEKLHQGQQQFKTDYEQYKLDNNLDDLSFDAYNDKMNKSVYAKSSEYYKENLKGKGFIGSTKQIFSDIGNNTVDKFNNSKFVQGGKNVVDSVGTGLNKLSNGLQTGAKHIMKNNPLTAIPNAIRYGNEEGKDLHLLDRLQGMLATTIEGATYGLVPFKTSMKGLGKTTEFLGKIGNGLQTGAKHLMENNPLNIVGHGWRLFSGEGHITDKLTEFLASSIQSFTYGAVNKDTIISGIDKAADILPKIGSAVLQSAKHLVTYNPMNVISRSFKGFSETDGSFTDKMLGSLGYSVEAITFGAVKPESTISGVNKAIEVIPQLGSAALQGAKHLVTYNPMNMIGRSFKGFFDTDGSFTDKMLGSLGYSIEALTFGAVKPETAISGLLKTEEVISKFTSSAIDGIKHLVTYNPMNMLSRAFKGYTDTGGDFGSKMLGSLSYSIEALTFGAVKNDTVTGFVNNSNIKQTVSDIKNKTRNFLLKNPLGAQFAFADAWKNTNGTASDKFTSSLGAAFESLTFGIVNKNDVSSFFDGFSLSSLGSSMWGGIKSIFGFGGEESKNNTTGANIPANMSAYGKSYGVGGGSHGGESIPRHFSQKDSRWKSQPFNGPKDTIKQTIGNSGCGPMSAAIVQSAYMPGVNIDPMNIADYAIKKGHKVINGGVSPQFFTDYLSGKGIITQNTTDHNDIINSLKNNKPVILMGQSKTGTNNTPFGTSRPHYVVATGIDSSGNMIVNDPDSTSGSGIFNIKNTLSSVKTAIRTSYKGKGMPQIQPQAIPLGGGGEGKMSVGNSYKLMQEIVKLGGAMIADIFGLPKDNIDQLGINGLPINSYGLIDMSLVSKEEVINRINEFFKKSSKLRNTGISYYNGYRKYGCDPLLAAAITMQETGGNSNALTNYNNPGGLMNPSTNWQTLQKFSSLTSGIDAMMKNLGSYGKKYNAYTIEEIGAVYSPVGAANDPRNLNKNWVSGVTKFYNQLTQGLQSNDKFNIKNVSSASSLVDFYTQQNMRVTSNYGNRKDPFGSGNIQFHKGIDFADRLGAPITSPVKGEVVQVYKNLNKKTGLGHALRVKDEKGMVHTFAHLKNKPSAPVGARINVGDYIGKMGNTGASTGPHLHYQINKSKDFTSSTVDPNAYFTQLGIKSNITGGYGKEGFTTDKTDNKHVYSNQGGSELSNVKSTDIKQNNSNVTDTLTKVIIELLVKVVENTNNLSAIVTLLSHGLKVDIPEKLLKSLKNNKQGVQTIIKDSVNNNGNINNDALIKSLERLAAE